MKFKLGITVLLLVIVMVFAVQNAAVVEINFLFWQMAIPRSLLIFMMLLVGMLIGWFLRAMFRMVRLKN